MAQNNYNTALKNYNDAKDINTIKYTKWKLDSAKATLDKTKIAAVNKVKKTLTNDMVKYNKLYKEAQDDLKAMEATWKKAAIKQASDLVFTYKVKLTELQWAIKSLPQI
jgi:hypothetical protein